MHPALLHYLSKYGWATYLKRGVNGFFANFVLAEFTTEKMLAQIDAPDQFILVSQNEDGIDGYIRLISPSHAPVEGCSDLEIATFYVQQRHRNKGIGRGFLGSIHSGFDTGCGVLTLLASVSFVDAGRE